VIARIITLNYTGSAQTFTVPAGVTAINIDAYGASSTTTCAAYGGTVGAGKGGRVETTLSVTSGQLLNIYVGGSSEYCGQSGWPSAYVGWNGGAGGYRSGGGGAADIRIGGTSLADRVIVSGGGGVGYSAAHGGDGGGLVGEDGQTAGSSITIGHGGTQSAGGGGYWHGGNSSTNQGTLGYGALGASVSGNGGNGHGGGGYYGGGGGVYDGSGGGGSSYTHPTLCSSVVHTQGGNTNLGNGSLTITIP
jgi:hypothetical protein